MVSTPGSQPRKHTDWEITRSACETAENAENAEFFSPFKELCDLCALCG